MKIEATVLIDIDGDEASAIKTVANILAMYEIVGIKRHEKKRTGPQNNSLHLWLTQLAKELNDAGFDLKSITREGYKIPCTMNNLKEEIWRPTQISLFGKKSTTKVSTTQIQEIYLVIDKAISERTGVHVEWPSIESLMNDYETNMR